MPTVDPFKYLMDAIGILTGGLINDLKTLFLGLLVCSFILMALDLLKDALLSPAATFGRVREMYNEHRVNNLPTGPTVYSSPNASSRAEVEISPLREYELDLAYRGVDSLPESSESIYDQSANNWEREGVTLPADRYQELDLAMQESEYNERQKHRMSSGEVEAMFDSMRRR